MKFSKFFNQNFFLKCLKLSQDYNPKFFKKTGDYELDPKLLPQTSSYSIWDFFRKKIIFSIIFNQISPLLSFHTQTNFFFN